ncbi:MAG: glycosyltransferase [Flavobacteriaceae bacterium]|nr:glycosyltransferase [Flavobacteriaceae bacterium]
MQKILISVTNDLVTDQRVKKSCEALLKLNFEIILIGRLLPNSLPLKRDYKTIRMKILFKKSFLFYAEYNIRLFFKLLFLKKDILLSNDLDTLLPNYLISKLQSKKLVYDSHELFTEVIELTSRPKIRNFWLHIEKYIFPKLKNVYTVNLKIAKIYTEKYKVPVKIIRNIAPKLQNKNINTKFSQKIKGNKKMLILQGSGINVDRGAEEAVAMMQYVDNSILYIIGSGDVFDKLKALRTNYKLNDTVFIKDKITYNELLEYTKIADLGLSLDKNTSLNYEYSLPNKVFDYIQCQIPILTSNREIIANLVSKNNIGYVTDTHNPKKLAEIVNTIFANQEQYNIYKENLKIASKKYTWESEVEKLKEIYLNLK